jgi:hypothetical protein
VGATARERVRGKREIARGESRRGGKRKVLSPGEEGKGVGCRATEREGGKGKIERGNLSQNRQEIDVNTEGKVKNFGN